MVSPTKKINDKVISTDTELILAISSQSASIYVVWFESIRSIWHNIILTHILTVTAVHYTLHSFP